MCCSDNETADRDRSSGKTARNHLLRRGLLQEDRADPVGHQRILVKNIAGLEIAVVPEREGEDAADPVLNGAETVGTRVGEAAPEADDRNVGVSELPAKPRAERSHQCRRPVGDLGHDLNDLVGQKTPQSDSEDHRYRAFSPAEHRGRAPEDHRDYEGISAAEAAVIVGTRIQIHHETDRRTVEASP